MAQIEKSQEQTTTVFRKSERREYGTVVSVDITPRLIKEFLQARMILKCMPPFGHCDEEIEQNNKILNEEVKPFFDHFEEVLNTL